MGLEARRSGLPERIGRIIQAPMGLRTCTCALLGLQAMPCCCCSGTFAAQSFGAEDEDTQPPLAPPLSASMITLVFYHRVCCAFKGHIGAVGIHQQTHPMHEHRVINRRTQITRSLQLKPIVRTVVYLCFRSSARPTRLGVLYYWGFVSFLPEARTFPCCIVAPWCTCCLNSAQPNDLCV